MLESVIQYTVYVTYTKKQFCILNVLAFIIYMESKTSIIEIFIGSFV